MYGLKPVPFKLIHKQVRRIVLQPDPAPQPDQAASEAPRRAALASTELL